MRYEPLAAQERALNGSVIVDLRCHDERVTEGVIPGSVHVPRSVLEWRVDPGSGFANPHVSDRGLELILVCHEGYSSSLAAAALQELGCTNVADLIGGFAAWREAGLETIAAGPPDRRTTRDGRIRPMSYDPVAFDAFEAAGWAEKDVDAYDMLLGRVTKRLAEPLLDAVAAGAGTRLLDLATGPGYVAGRAVARGAKAVGLDLSEGMLEFARRHVPGVEFVRGDVTALPFEDESFNAVTAAFVLLHLAEPERAAAEAARVLEPGGAVAFTVWNVPARGRWLGVVVDAIEEVGVAAPNDVPAGPPFFRFPDEKELTQLITGAGLADAAVRTVEFPLEVASKDELWDGVIEGAVRTRALVHAQSDDVQRAIRARFDELLDDHSAGDGFEVSVSVKLGSGRKP